MLQGIKKGARTAAVRLLPALSLLLGSGGHGAVAQYFGQNKVQYEELHWSVLRTRHVEILFHEGEKKAAVDAGRLAERAYDRLSLILDHQVKDPIRVILYASPAEFQRTNVTPDILGEGTGGFTEFQKRRVTVPLTGSYREFDHVLTHELVHAFQMDMMSGGQDRALGGSLRYQPPLWFEEGMAEYLSLAGLDPQTEMWLRDGALEGYLTPLRQLAEVEDIRVYRYGQAVFSYLGATYGDQVIGQILRNVSRDRSLDRAFERAAGLTLEKFSEDWLLAVRRQYLPEIREHRRPEEFAFRLTKAENDLSNMNLGPALSPDGGRMVYFSDRSLYDDLYLASALTGRIERRLVKSERSSDFESLRFFSSSTDWSPDGQKIVFVALAGGRDALEVLRVRDGKLLRRIRAPLDALLSPSWSPDGRWIVFSGLRDGSLHLYRVRADGGDCEELTEGRYTAQEPRFSPDGRQILFVTDRGLETDPDNLLFSRPRMALLDLETRQVTLLPGQAGRNLSPHFFPDGRHLVFISDRSGIPNLYLRDMTTGEDRRITDILTGVCGVTPTSPALSLSRNGARLVFSAFRRGSWDLYSIKEPLTLWDKGTRWESPAAVAVAPPAAADSLGRALRRARFDSLMASLTGELPSGAARAGGLRSGGSDSTPADSSAAPVSASSATASGSRSPAPTGAAGWSPQEVAGETASRDSLLRRIRALGAPAEDSARVRRISRYGRAGAETDTLRRAPTVAEVFAQKTALPDPASFEVGRYRSHFTADYASANGFFAGNVGLAAQSDLQFSDLLGDQVILLGANVYGSLSDSDLLFEYLSLKHRINWGVSAFQYRNDFYIYAAEQNDAFQSQIYRGVNVTVQRPGNRYRRLELSLSALSVANQVFRESFSGGIDSVTVGGRSTYYYAAPGAALVTDNTIYGSTGPIGGGRNRVSVEAGVGDLSYRSVVGDLRRYVNLRHQYALAGRVIAATSDGRDPQVFRIGGPYTLRGFPYGEFPGTKIVLANLEFRFPLIEQLLLGFPLHLVLGGVRGAVFFDAGSAWVGASGFRGTEYRDGHRRLRDIRASYGLSASVNLGFTVLKWDLSFPTDLAQNLGPARGYLSLGLDY